ncbi:MAG: hypothetical protein WA139_04305 [Candidatus Aenigmatarchaeota archaeon]
MNKVILISITLFVAVLTTNSNVGSSYCPPYFAHIDNITPQISCLDINDRTNYCGGAIEIINHCNEEFYFYNENGSLDNNKILVNFERWEKNISYYNDLRSKTGRYFRGFDYRQEPSIMEKPELFNLTNISAGSVVKNWTIKMRSSNGTDITVTGRTVYESSSDNSDYFDYFVSVALSSISIAVLSILAILAYFYIRKKKK